MISSSRPTIGSLLRHGIKALEQAGLEEAVADATQLLGHCLQLSRTTLYLRDNEVVTRDQELTYLRLLNRRLDREPLAYIIGEREFWSLPFYVTPDVLIPRPETEFLLEMVFAKRNPSMVVNSALDMCCGSGIIAVVLARELACTVWAIDISAQALRVARKNGERHGVSALVTFIQADLFSSLHADQQFSLIVANPPYVKHSDIITTLEPEVARFEPLLALNGGESGLDLIGRIGDGLPSILSPGGDFFMEIGDGQGAAVTDMFLGNQQRDLYEFVHLYRDYGGRERVIHIRKKCTGENE